MNRVFLGTFGAAHLGDALCASPLPRVLVEHHDCEVCVEDTPNYRNVFKGNPDVTGYVAREAPKLRRRFRGAGHIIQRFQQGFRLPVEANPRPELYLDEAERTWATEQRDSWITDKLVIFVATRAIVDKHHLTLVDWPAIDEVLSERFTIVQAILTRHATYTTEISPLTTHERLSWQPEPILPGAIVYRDLSVRQFFALISACDAYLGPPSGGSHVAAAFNLPSLIIIWDEVLARLRFPVCTRRSCVEVFLCPNHRFVSATHLARHTIRYKSRPSITVNAFRTTWEAVGGRLGTRHGA